MFCAVCFGGFLMMRLPVFYFVPRLRIVHFAIQMNDACVCAHVFFPLF